MVRIRLRRVGGKKQASFRIVAADKESPRDGRFIEVLGFYNPRTEPATINLKEDRIYHWISNGAQPSDSVNQVFQVAGLLERFERFKSGEKVEALLAEAEAASEKRNVSHLTRREAPAAGSSTRKQAVRAAEAAKAAEAPKAEPAAEAKVQAPAEEAPKAEEAAAPDVEAPAEEAPKVDETAETKAEVPAEEAPQAEEAGASPETEKETPSAE